MTFSNSNTSPSKNQIAPSFYHGNVLADDNKTVLMSYTSTRPIDQKTIDDLSAAFVSGVSLEDQIQQAAAGKFDREVAR